MSVPETEQKYPPPAPPAKKNYDRQFNETDERAKNAPDELNSSFEDLVCYLTQNVTFDLDKVRAVLVWLSRQNFLTVSKPGQADETSPAGFLTLVALKKQDLVSLFCLLCRKIGIPCVIISGYCKQEAEIHATLPQFPQINSRWAAVYADGQWGFVHPTLIFSKLRVKRSRAIRIEATGKAVRERDVHVEMGSLDDTFFLPDPEKFIYMCRPQNDAWQLLKGAPWTWDKFIGAPDRRPPTPKPDPPQPSSPARSPVPRPSTALVDELSVPDFQDGYPLPCPPRSCKKDVINQREFQKIDKRSKNTPAEVYYSYQDLFAYLFHALRSDVKKARALLAWMSVNCNYSNSNITEEMYQAATDPDTPVGAIKLRCPTQRRGNPFIKEQFFAVLCRRAKLPCVVIRGRKKRADLYKLGDKSILKEMAWNAVYLDGSWRLINTHDAILHLTYTEWLETDAKGNIREAHTEDWTDEFTEFFFLTDPDEFIHFCFPDDPRWQLLKTPLTEHQFMDEPWVHPLYFQSLWRLSLNCGVCVQAEDGKSKVLLEGNVDTKNPVRYNLYYIQDDDRFFQEELQLGSYVALTSVSKAAPERSILFSLPQTGMYVLETINKAGKTLCKLLISCFGDTTKNQPFPRSPDGGLGHLEVVDDEVITLLKKIEAEMMSAAEDNDVNRLDMALKESRRLQLHKLCGEKQLRAQRQLMTLFKDAFAKTAENSDVRVLESVVDSAHQSQMSYYIHRSSWFASAEERLRLLKRQRSKQWKAETINQKHVAEVSRYKSPHPHMHTVMTATFTLLGERTQDLKNWQCVQSFLRAHGANSVLQRIQNYRRGVCKEENLQRAASLLKPCTLQAVTSVSPGAAAFYQWVQSVLEQKPDNEKEPPQQVIDAGKAEEVEQDYVELNHDVKEARDTPEDSRMEPDCVQLNNDTEDA